MNATEQAFKTEFLALLKKYDVEVSVIESSHGHPESISFFAYTKWDTEGKVIQECINLDMSRLIYMSLICIDGDG